MAVYTVVKKIGATNTPTTMEFSTLQPWEDAAPADLTTAEKSAAGTFVGTFTAGETLNFTGSGATGTFLETDGSTYIVYGITSGNPAASDVCTGATSLAHCVISSGTPQNVGVIYRGECYNQGNLAGFAIAGETTSATCYIELTTATGASFRDNANVRTNALYPNSSNGVYLTTNNNYATTFTCSVDFTRFSYLQMVNAGAGQALGMSSSAGANASRVDSCIIMGGRSLTENNFAEVAINCLLINHGIFGGSPGATAGNLYNCTIIEIGVTTSNAGMAGNNYGATRNHHNCAVFNFTDLVSGAAGGTSDYAATDSTTGLEGAHTVSGLTFASQFVSSTNDFRAISSGGLKAGTPDATNAPVDISGFTRDATTPYIGAWEVASSGVAAIFQPRRLRMGVG